ncbi:MAG: hypothetical protein J6I40_02115 [Mailhella sp.]|nr:hypothetical protein [Mailhella sp.]
METVLATRGDAHFCISQDFQGIYLCPIVDNLKDKLVNGSWDDYNEAFHCCRLIHEFRKRPGLQIDFHTMSRGQEYLGLAIMSHGNIDPQLYASSGIHFSEPLEQVLLFNYFHISPFGRGNGYFWLTNVIMPWYAERGFKAIYMKSSHPKAFSLYSRLGTVIGEYTAKSDNGVFDRPGRIFRVALQ